MTNIVRLFRARVVEEMQQAQQTLAEVGSIYVLCDARNEPDLPNKSIVLIKQVNGNGKSLKIGDFVLHTSYGGRIQIGLIKGKKIGTKRQYICVGASKGRKHAKNCLISEIHGKVIKIIGQE